MKYKTSELPELDKLIRLNCYDWSPYYCFGKRVLYKPKKNSKRKPGWRLMVRQQDGSFDSNMTAWKDCETWEYSNE